MELFFQVVGIGFVVVMILVVLLGYSGNKKMKEQIAPFVFEAAVATSYFEDAEEREAAFLGYINTHYDGMVHAFGEWNTDNCLSELGVDVQRLKYFRALKEMNFNE